MPQQKKRISIPRELKKHGRAWYNGMHYKNHQSFATFLFRRGRVNPENLVHVLGEIRKLIPAPQRAIASRS